MLSKICKRSKTVRHSWDENSLLSLSLLIVFHTVTQVWMFLPRQKRKKEKLQLCVYGARRCSLLATIKQTVALRRVKSSDIHFRVAASERRKKYKRSEFNCWSAMMKRESASHHIYVSFEVQQPDILCRAIKLLLIVCECDQNKDPILSSRTQFFFGWYHWTCLHFRHLRRVLERRHFFGSEKNAAIEFFLMCHWRQWVKIVNLGCNGSAM
jgi:hypothetical protein